MDSIVVDPSLSSQEFVVSSLGELDALALSLSKGLSKEEILLVEGDLGAGKTELCKRILRVLGSDEGLSPTFSIVHSYSLSGRQVHHLDLYRLESDEDLESTGFWDLLSEPPYLVLMEWGDKIDARSLVRPGRSVQRLEIKVEPDGMTRRICLKRLSK